MIWSALKTELRVELEDNGTTPKWSDEVLYTYLREAIADYSQYFPLMMDGVALIPEVSNVRKFLLPNDFLEEVSVVCPADNSLEMRKERPGSLISSGSRPSFYYVEGLSLYLDTNPSSDNVLLTYSAVHALPSTSSDDTFVLTIPLVDVELIKLYVIGKVNTRVRNAQSRLDRFKLGSGTREDNPMKGETEDYFSRYYRKVAERMRPTAHLLSRPRRYR